MKKLLLILSIIAGYTVISQAATITVSAGFNSSTMIYPTFWDEPHPVTLAVGSWDGSTFTQFGDAITDTGSINGSFTATGPAEVNGDTIFLWVGVGPVSVAGDGIWALFRTSSNTAFPADVSNTLGSATFNMHNSTPGTVIFVAGNNVTFFGNSVGYVPEPSALLLGVLGCFGLLRRRR